ncbi:serine protease inhibitor, Kazal-type family protein [Thalictrum thalictroides]|uniref:Serine protease inhibitor, Kazal-type family protein n=1 Tax=Thalictrum thalictroides TaxID=46969 RepID=A0A7J6UZS5_THATH|nr:serine protease inhibitor, Kazal-type family protein [Thalictrum thalictroides]
MPNSLILLISFLLLFNLSLCVRSQIIRLPTDKDIASSIIQDPDLDLCPPISKPLSCPVNCFRTDPVCGVDGITYWCGCADAHCSATRVAKLGFCEVGNAGNGPVSGQALLLVHIVWLIVLGFSVLFGLF